MDEVMIDESLPSNEGGEFPRTAWTLIRHAQDADVAERMPALNQLIANYWKPVFYFLRAKGHSFHNAEDLTQDFFTRFCERDWIRRADPARGRFRTFLLTILVRFLSDCGPRRAPLQARFEQQLVSIASMIGDDERSYEPGIDETPEAFFMQRWAQSVVGQVLEQLRRLCHAEGRLPWHDLFMASYFADGEGRHASHQDLAEKFGMTREQVRHALKVVKDRFMRLLRAEVRDQVDSERDINEEIRELIELLGA